MWHLHVVSIFLSQISPLVSLFFFRSLSSIQQYRTVAPSLLLPPCDRWTLRSYRSRRSCNHAIQQENSQCIYTTNQQILRASLYPRSFSTERYRDHRPRKVSDGGPFFYSPKTSAWSGASPLPNATCTKARMNYHGHIIVRSVRYHQTDKTRR